MPPIRATAEEATMIDSGPGSEPAKPRALQIVSVDKTGVFVLNEDSIEIISKNLAQKHLPVSVVSIAGPFRKGKSFMLNFFLRYLSHQGDTDWLGSEDAPLEGFKWRPGAERETVGIWMWSHPFIRKDISGHDIAVLLVDTQGTFDNRSTMKENAVIFALNALISSFHVYNISALIQEDILQHMHLFTQFGVLAQKGDAAHEKPFQALTFLVRDWSNPTQFEYGEEGGKAYLSSVLYSGDGKKELVTVRDQIQGCFQTLNCFLMPHPGFDVSEKADFNGRLSLVRPEFLSQLRKFVPLVLGTASLLQKTVYGENVTFDGLVDYLRSYVDVFKLGDMPEIGTVFDATARVNHLNIKRGIVDQYRQDMARKAGPGRPYMVESDLDMEHERLKEQAISKFRVTKKLGANHFESEFLELLLADITKIYEEHFELNKHKQLLSTMRTPIVLTSLSFATHVLGMLFLLFGMSSVATLLSYMTWCCLLAIATWFYSSYSGNLYEAAGEIDRFAKVLEDFTRSFFVSYYLGSDSQKKKN